MAGDGALQRFGEARGLLPEGRRSSDRRTWEQPRGCWEEKKEKRLSRTVRREPAGSSGSAVRSPVQPVRFRLNLFPGQMGGPDRNGDRSTVGPAGPVRFLKHCQQHTTAHSKDHKWPPTHSRNIPYLSSWSDHRPL